MMMYNWYPLLEYLLIESTQISRKKFGALGASSPLVLASATVLSERSWVCIVFRLQALWTRRGLTE